MGLFGGTYRRQRELDRKLADDPFLYEPNAGTAGLAAFTDLLAKAVLDGHFEDAKQLAGIATWYTMGVESTVPQEQFKNLAPDVLEGLKDGSLDDLATFIRSGLRIDRDNAVGRQLLALLDGPADKTNGRRLSLVKHPDVTRMGKTGDERKRLERQERAAMTIYEYCDPREKYETKINQVAEKMNVSRQTVQKHLPRDVIRKLNQKAKERVLFEKLGLRRRMPLPPNS